MVDGRSFQRGEMLEGCVNLGKAKGTRICLEGHTRGASYLESQAVEKKNHKYMWYKHRGRKMETLIPKESVIWRIGENYP